jgi:photosystem II stability/assembly factor-like uncharacterized protein
MKNIMGVVFFMFQTVLCQWMWQNPLPQNNHLKAIKYITSTFVLAVGENGTVLKSMDAGATWIKLPAPKNPGITGEITNPLSSISFINPSVGWIVGGYSIFKTTDGGNSWMLQSLGVNRSMNAIFFVDENIGFVGGDNGELYKSTNGGGSWTKQTVGTNIGAIYTMQFLNATTGWIGGASLIARTTDGTTWIKIGSVTSTIYQLSFIDAANGYAAGQYGAIYRSDDGGVIWSKVTAPTTSYSFYSLSFRNTTTGIIAGGRSEGSGTAGKMYRTTNSGTTWTEVPLGTIEQLNSITFIDANNGLAVGNCGKILRTTNGGDTWPAMCSGFRFHLNSSSFLDANTGFVVGDSGNSSGIMYKTIDGGSSWQRVAINSGRLTSVYFRDASKGWIGGSSGIFKTTNGGSSWVQQNASYQAAQFYFFDTAKGFAVTPNQIIKTTNGGTEWTVIGSSYFLLKDICFTGALTGYAVGGGSENYLLQTIDGGATWTKNTAMTYGMNAIFFIDANTGWACGTGMYKTTNAGTAWTKQKMDVDGPIFSVYFIDKDKGCAVGNGGQFWLTTNGGTSWARSWPAVGFDLNKITFVSPTTGWIVGLNGTILKTTTGGAVWVRREQPAVEGYALLQNFPNPFNPATTIRYTLPASGHVRLTIYDLLGREIATVINEEQDAGWKEAVWNAQQFSSGIYFYRLSSGGFTETKDMVLMK